MGDVSLGRPTKAEPAAGGVAQGNRILGLMSAGWTDETHMLYISSMEASFVEQLHNHEHNTNQNNSSGNGFKVLRRGMWEKKKFERTNGRARIGGKYCLPTSPWIQHFRLRDCSCNARGDRAEAILGDHESGIRNIRGRTAVSHGREWAACKRENLLDDNTEVSDQNFADDEVEVDAELSKECKRRRLSNTSTTAPNE